MTIEKLFIEGFGIFHEQPIEGFKPGLNVLFGANEAGKSTLLDFLRFTLFEYPRRIEDRRPPLNGGKHGGRIWLKTSSQESLTIYRSGSGKGFELTYRGEEGQSEHLFQRLINNASNDLYENIYAITIDELVGVGTLNKSGMDNRIFSIGMGLSGVDFGAVEQALAQRAEQLYKKRGSTQVLSHLTDQIHKKEDKISGLRSRLDEYNRFSEEKEHLEKELAGLEEKREKLGEDKNRWEAWSKSYDSYVAYKDAENRIGEIGELAVYPDVLLDQYEEVKRRWKSEKEQIGKLSGKIKQLEDKKSSVTWDKQLYAHRALLDYFKKNIKLYEQAKDGEKTEQENIQKAENNSRVILQRLGETLNGEDLIKIEGTFALRSKATETAEKEQKVENTLAIIKSKEADLKRAFEEIAARKKNLENQISQHSIKDEKQREQAEKEKINLDTAFKEGLNTKGSRQSKPFSLPLLLTSVFIVLGIVLLFIHRPSGLIVLGIAIISLIIVLFQKQKVPKSREAEPHDLNEVNSRLNQLASDINQYDECLKDLKEVQFQYQQKEKDLKDLKEKLTLLEQEKREEEKVWQEIINEKNLPAHLTPQRTGDFIDNIEELKRQNINSSNAQQSLNQYQKTITSFEAEVAKVAPNREIDSAFIFLLIARMEKNEEAEFENRQLSQQIEELKQEINEKERIIQGLAEEIEEFHSKIKVENEIGFYRYFEEITKLKQALKDKSNAEKTIETICGSDLLKETLKTLGDISNLDLKDKKDAALLAYEQVKEACRDTNNNLTELRTQIRHILSPDEMYAYQNEKESLQEQLKEAAKEWLTLQMASTILYQSKEKYEKERQPQAILQALKYFKSVTKGAYTDLRVSLSNKEVNIIDQSGTAKGVEALSRGTREQLLLSMRLGLIEEYEKQAEPLPVVFDDIMVNFDNKRATKMAEVLNQFAAGRQVLYFTCHESIKELLSSQGANVLKWESDEE